LTQQELAMPNTLFLFSEATQAPCAQDFKLNFRLFAAMRQVLRRRSHAIPVTIMTRADFIHHVTLHMPEVASRIEEDDFGVLHLEMGAMKLATREAIVRYEFHTVRRHFTFIAYLFDHADAPLRDAIVVSYLGSLFIGDATSQYVNARGLLPANLASALKKLELRYRRAERRRILR